MIRDLCARELVNSARHFPYIEGGEVISVVQDFLDGISCHSDDSVNNVHHTVGGHLVSMDDPGTVDCHNLLQMGYFILAYSINMSTG